MDRHLEQLVTCAVCLDRFKSPKILPCQHTFCMRPCLQNLVVDKSIRCPQCRSTHRVPRTGLVGFPNNLTIISILELPSPHLIKEVDLCEECLREDCKPSKCTHCEKKLCESCSDVHLQHLLQSLARSVNQVRKVIPKVSEMISGLEERQIKSVTRGNAVKAEVNQAIERCVNELKNRRNVLMDHVDLFVAEESRHLRVEQDTLELELATLSSHCDAAEKKYQTNCDINNSNIKMSPNEICQLTRQSQEHFRNVKTITSNIDDSMRRTVKFHREREKSLLSAAAGFGEIAYNTPTRLSLTLGSDRLLNEAEIDRAITNQQAVYGRRAADIIDTYVPSFATPLLDVPGHFTHAVSPVPSGGSISPYNGSSGSTTNSPRAAANGLPVPVISNDVSRRRRRIGQRFPSTDTSDRIASYLPLNDNRHSLERSIFSPTDINSTDQTPQSQYRAKGPVKRCFGTKGSDLGCLNWPRGVAVTPNDNIIVADSSNHRIHVFERDGTPVLTFGGYGTEEGQFDCLAGAHVTAQGWIITADRYNHRIQIFDSMGRFIRMFGQEGSGEGDLSYPWGVATDNMGFVYVCDKDNHRVQVFTLDGQFIRKFGRLGTHEGQFDSPQYLVVTHDNKVLVSDSGNHRIQVFDKYGRFLFKFGREGSADGQLKYPRGIAVDSRGNIIVGDSGNNRIQVYRHDGVYLAGFGSWGPSPGQMKGIEGVALLSNNDIIISDRENHRVQIF